MSTRRRASVEALSPELLFLDIQMPGGSGFDLLTRLDYLPQVVFTTAHDEHAVRAFEVNALDYVLKPIDPERLAAAVSRVKAAPAVAAPDAVLEQIFVKDGPRCWFVPLREVRLLTSEGNYVRLSWGNKQPLLGRALRRARATPRPEALLSGQSSPDPQPGFHRGRGARRRRAPARAASRWVPKWRSPGARRGCSGCERTFDGRGDGGSERAVRGRGVGRPAHVRSEARAQRRAQSCAAAARPPLR